MTRSSGSIVITLLAAVLLSGCTTTAPAASADPERPSQADSSQAPSSLAPSSLAPSSQADPSRAASSPAGSRPAGSSHAGSSQTGSTHAGSSATHPSHSASPTGPRIVTFRIAQRPKCAEGTAVFRADPVPLIIEWKITGATGGALSVDDPTHTPGTYGSVPLEGRQDFQFTCAGDVGTTETHTYALYTVGGGKTRSATITASAKILDKGR